MSTIAKKIEETQDQISRLQGRLLLLQALSKNPEILEELTKEPVVPKTSKPVARRIRGMETMVYKILDSFGTRGATSADVLQVIQETYPNYTTNPSPRLISLRDKRKVFSCIEHDSGPGRATYRWFTENYAPMAVVRLSKDGHADTINAKDVVRD